MIHVPCGKEGHFRHVSTLLPEDAGTGQLIRHQVGANPGETDWSRAGRQLSTVAHAHRSCASAAPPPTPVRTPCHPGLSEARANFSSFPFFVLLKQ